MKRMYALWLPVLLLTVGTAWGVNREAGQPDARTAATDNATEAAAAPKAKGAAAKARPDRRKAAAAPQLTVALKLSGTPLPANTKVARLVLRHPADTVTLELEAGMAPRTFDLPVGTRLTLEAAEEGYRGYVFQGLTAAGKGKPTAGPLTATLPAKGLRIEAHYAADAADSSQYLFYTYDRDGAPYRIPAIACTRGGALVAFSDKRWCGADIGYGHIDVVARISTDNGASWGEPFTVADGSGTDGAKDCGYGDVAVVADADSDRLLVISATGHRTYWAKRDNPLRTARYYSDDGGLTWNRPEDITEAVYALVPGADGIFLGSGRICQSRLIKAGSHYRLYAALATQPTGNFVIYSDDFGRSWAVLGSDSVSCAPRGDEPKCEELPDGSVLLSSRKHGGRYYNVFTYADRAAATGSWAEAVASDEVPGGLAFGKNATNGEVLVVDAVEQATGALCTLLLQSVPTGEGRSHVSLYYKVVENRAYTPAELAAGWTKGLQVSPRGSAYSTMCRQADGRIGFYYEEEPNWYCMVYEPLRLERITDGRFRAAPRTVVQALP